MSDLDDRVRLLLRVMEGQPCSVCGKPMTFEELVVAKVGPDGEPAHRRHEILKEEKFRR